MVRLASLGGSGLLGWRWPSGSGYISVGGLRMEKVRIVGCIGGRLLSLRFPASTKDIGVVTGLSCSCRGVASA